MNLGLIGYSGALIAYGVFAFLLLISWRGEIKGGILTACIIINALWAGSAVLVASSELSNFIKMHHLFEVFRYACWFLLLFKLFEYRGRRLVEIHPMLHKSRYVVSLYIVLTLIIVTTKLSEASNIAPEPSQSVFLGLMVFAPIIGLVLLEQLARNINRKQLGISKFLFLGLGGIFVFDLFLYSHALMFGAMDAYLWEMRGYINILSVPLIAVSIARNKNLTTGFYVSRDVVLHSTTFIGSGVYLLLMSLAGFYIKEIGGSWGGLFQVVFLSLSGLLLILVLFSNQLRAKFRVFLGKHFYKNRYDYRYEWLRLTRGLTNSEREEDRFEHIIKSLGVIVNCRAGSLWLSDRGNGYNNVSTWSDTLINNNEPGDSIFIQFLKNKGYIINLDEIKYQETEYADLELPDWLERLDKPWLIIPLFAQDHFIGFVILSNILVKRDINWEDRDLLKAAAKQIANYIEVQLASDAISEIKQFEAFNRLSAYMVHDLKNISAELRLVSKNAIKFRDNPEFLDDAFETVTNAANDIDKVVGQLKGRRVEPGIKSKVDMLIIVQSAIAQAKERPPVTLDTAEAGNCFVESVPEKLMSVIKHLIDNAQEATAETGNIHLTLFRRNNDSILAIKDNGIGMTPEFIRDRLFKPFDTTKGNAGMGIGMYESRDIIRSLGGDIDIESQVNVGTTITVRIPVV